MSGARTWVLGSLLLASAAGTLLLSAQRQDGFPHEAHAGLFPLCEGCHTGIPTGNEAEFYPPPAACLGCHDGEQLARVEWTGPTPRVNNLIFDHPTHAAHMIAETGQRLDCAVCHSLPETPRMHVEYAVVSQCLDCHAHAAQDHFVDADCSTCHVPLAQTRFTLARIEALPVPETHLHPEFLTELHGRLAVEEPLRCATCHTREQCASCHVDAARVAQIGQIPRAHAAMQLPAFTARYPIPPSHLDPTWEVRHGAVASVAACATCHTRESCMTCHAAPPPPVVAQHPSAAEAMAPGAFVARSLPESHLSPFFLTQHGPLASARPQSCQTCHTQARFCGRCHDPVTQLEPARPAEPTGPARPVPAVHAEYTGYGTADDARAVSVHSSPPVPVPALAGAATAGNGAPPLHLTVQAADTIPPGREREAARTPGTRGGLLDERPRPSRPAQQFHPPNYMARHSAEAYGRRLECSNCHNTRVFCRECHEQAGFGTIGRLGPGFHDAEPLWLLRHGQPARQALESCATCHGQRDCMQCHSELGSFRVNPHGPGFNAERAERRNPQVCTFCHITDPLRRSP